MQIIHKTDTWPPNAGDYQSCLVLYDHSGVRHQCWELTLISSK